jgi:hypothetical protein
MSEDRSVLATGRKLSAELHQELGVSVDIAVDVGARSWHGYDRAGPRQRLPDAAVGQPDANEPGELAVGEPRNLSSRYALSRRDG